MLYAPLFAQDDPLLRPIAPEWAGQWLESAPPVRVHGNTWLVGFKGLSIVLIATTDGLVLIDGAVPQAVPTIKENIRALGFRVEDIKYILSTEPHYDHAGGIAALARDSGAVVLAAQEAVTALRVGQNGKDDPQFGALPDFPGISNVRAMGDRERVTVGDTVVTAFVTPGHTPGSTTWTWESCDVERCLNIVFAASFSPITSDHYRHSEYPSRVAAFRNSIKKLRSMPCDVLIRSHPAKERSESTTNACGQYAKSAERQLDGKLAEENSTAH